MLSILPHSNRLRQAFHLFRPLKKTLFGCILIFFLLSPGAAAERLIFPFDFDFPIIKSQGDQHTISMTGLTSIGNPGEPVLPIQTACILLPPGHKLSRISVDTAPQKFLPERYHLLWGQRQRPLSFSHEITPSIPDAAIYSSDSPFPQNVTRTVGTWSLRGHRIAVITLHPVRYIPAEGILSYFPRITLQLETESSADLLAETARMLRTSQDVDTRLSDLVENPELLEAYAAIAQSVSKGNPPDPLNAEMIWACYAWPIKKSVSGNRVFFINHQGDILASDNEAPTQQYSGVNAPAPDAAFLSPTTASSIMGPLAVNTRGTDGGMWTNVD